MQNYIDSVPESVQDYVSAWFDEFPEFAKNMTPEELYGPICDVTSPEGFDEQFGNDIDLPF